MLPIFVKLGPITITSFGLLLSLGFLVLMFLSYRAVKDRVDISIEELFDAIFFIALGALIGARIFYILFHFDQFGFDILHWLLMRERPGLSFAGSVFGAGFVFLLVARVSTIAWGKIIDDLVSGLVMLLFFGQIGALLDGFSYGKATELPWGVTILGQATPRHPLPAYYLPFLIFFLFLLGKLRRLSRKDRWPEATVFLLFTSSYSAFSTLVNFLRQETTVVASISLDHLVTSTIFLGSTVALYTRMRSFKADLSSALAFFLTRVQNITRYTLSYYRKIKVRRKR